MADQKNPDSKLSAEEQDRLDHERMMAQIEENLKIKPTDDANTARQKNLNRFVFHKDQQAGGKFRAQIEHLQARVKKDNGELVMTEEAKAGYIDGIKPAEPATVSGDTRKNVEAVQPPGQRFAVIILAHLGQRPTSNRPAFCVLGTFQTRENANAFVDDAWKPHFGKPYVVEVAVPFPITVNQATFQSPADRDAVRADVLARHAKRRANDNLKFKKTIAERTTQRANLSDEAVSKKQLTKFQESSRAAVLARVSSVKSSSSAAKLTAPESLPVKTGQTVALVAIIRDVESDVRKKQPVVVVFGAFADEKRALEHASVCKRLIADFDYDVADLGRWLFPEDVDSSKIPTDYQQPALSEIMQYRGEENKLMEDTDRLLAKINADTAAAIGPDSSSSIVESVANMGVLTPAPSASAAPATRKAPEARLPPPPAKKK